MESDWKCPRCGADLRYLWDADVHISRGASSEINCDKDEWAVSSGGHKITWLQPAYRYIDDRQYRLFGDDTIHPGQAPDPSDWDWDCYEVECKVDMGGENEANV